MSLRLANIGRIILLASIALLLACSPLLLAQAASAHANLVRAEPAPFSVLEQPPGKVTISFSEPVEPRYSEIQVLDAQGKQVDSHDSLVDSRDPTSLSVSLPVLPGGTYTVVWRTVSAADGHAAGGSFIFSVGTPSANAGAVVQVAQPLLQSPADPILKWLALLSLLALVGGLGFELLVWRPVLTGKRANKAMGRVGDDIASNSSKLSWVAMGVFGGASIGQLISQAMVANNIPFYKALGSPIFSLLISTKWGNLWLWRIALLLGAVALIAVFHTSLPGEGDKGKGRVLPQARLLLPLALACGILLTLSLVSHAAATTEIQAVAISLDYLHLLAAAFWVGGLFHFASAFPIFERRLSPEERRLTLSLLVPRFSTLATLSVGTLIITGLSSARIQVAFLQALATPYGLTLLIKIGIIVPLLFLGALNLLWIRPRLSSEEKATKQLRRLVTAEAVLATLVLLSVGFLTSLEPARQVASREAPGEQTSLAFHDTVEGAHIVLEIAPGRVGLNRAGISLVDSFFDPISNATDVSLSFKYLNADLGDNVVSAVPVSAGNYVVEKVLLSVAGPWRVELVVRRPDAFDARTSFRFEVSPGPNAGSAAPTAIPSNHQHDFYQVGEGTGVSNLSLILSGVIAFLILGALIFLGLHYLKRVER